MSTPAPTSAPGPLARSTVARYATGTTPIAVLGLPFTVYLPPYIADGGTIAVGLVGLLFTLTIIWDGIVDPLIGTVIDRVPAGDAPHRRWMFRAALPLVLLLLVLVTVGDTLPFAVLLIVLLLYYSSFSLYDVAHLSWGAALAGSLDDSSRLFGAREWAAKLVLIAAFGAPALAQALIPGLSLQGRILAYVSLVAIALPLALIAIRQVPARSIQRSAAIDWRGELTSLAGFPAFRWLLAVQLATSFAFGSLTALFIFYADGVLGLDGSSALMLFATFIGGAITTPLWTALARRRGKRPAMMAMAGFLSLVILAAPFLPPGVAPLAIGFSALLGSGFVGLIFIYGMVADLAPVDRQRCGRDRTGLLYAITNLTQKAGQALAIGLSYAALDLAGFAPGAAAESAGAIALLFVMMPAAGWLLTIVFLVPLGREPALARPQHIR